MIDTLKLELRDYEIGEKCALTVAPSPYRVDSGQELCNYRLWVNEAGSVEGAKAYYNDSQKRFNLSVQPLQGVARAFVNFSIPKIHNGSNFYSVGRDGARAVVGKVEGLLREAGVRCNLQDAKLSRVDTFRNVLTSETFPSYHPVLSLLDMKRTQKRDYGTTFTFGNTQQEVCVYDKIQEMRVQEMDVTPYPSNAIRFEHRLFGHSKIDKALGVSTVGELWKNYGVLETQYKEVLQRGLFRFSVSEVEVKCADQIRAELMRFKETYGVRSYRARFLKAYGLQYLIGLATMDVIKSTFVEVQGNRMAKTRIIRELDEVKRDFSFIQKEKVSQKTLSSLYNELRVKLCLN